METYVVTHQGLERRENQDRYFIREFEDRTILSAVADGMGGEANGGLAAQTAVEAFKDFDSNLAAVEASFAAVFQAADRRIREEIRKSPQWEGMGTTLTSAYLKKGEIHWAHVGDSRLYLFRAGGLTQVTEDHTLVTRLVQNGTITKEEARVHPLQNILLHCLGCKPMVINSGRFQIHKNDLVLLCTDGLYHEVSEEEIVSILIKKISIKEKFEGLLQAALDGGGHDNITLLGVTI
jgi:serine/threonine protein phosphatase PrpC